MCWVSTRIWATWTKFRLWRLGQSISKTKVLVGWSRSAVVRTDQKWSNQWPGDRVMDGQGSLMHVGSESMPRWVRTALSTRDLLNLGCSVVAWIRSWLVPVGPERSSLTWTFSLCVRWRTLYPLSPFRSTFPSSLSPSVCCWSWRQFSSSWPSNVRPPSD